MIKMACFNQFSLTINSKTIILLLQVILIYYQSTVLLKVFDLEFANADWQFARTPPFDSICPRKLCNARPSLQLPENSALPRRTPAKELRAKPKRRQWLRRDAAPKPPAAPRAAPQSPRTPPRLLI